MFKQLDLFGSDAKEKENKPFRVANADKQDLPVVAKTEAVADKDKTIQAGAEENGPAKDKKPATGVKRGEGENREGQQQKRARLRRTAPSRPGPPAGS